MSNPDDRVKVYGTTSCGATRMTRRRLDELGVPYSYIEVEGNPEASAWVKSHNRGLEMKPTVDVEGEVLSAPPNHVLDGVLQSHGIISG